MPFTFEKLSVYQKSLAFVGEIENLITALKGKSSFSLLDQLSRAAVSIPLNIAEGAGRWHKKEKTQFLRIAKGSVFEIVPIIQILEKKQLIGQVTYHQLYADLETLAKMISGLEKSVESLRDEKRPSSRAEELSAGFSAATQPGGGNTV